MTVCKIWKTKSSEVTDEAIKACNGNRVLAVLLSNRGIDSPEKINNFLNPLKNKLSSPDVFVDMEKTILRIKQAVEKNEHITVYGDFDTDGITSTALLYLTLKEIGANVSYYLPDRSSESHGLNTKAIVKIISKNKSKLIITVDCGISNIAEVNFAKSFKTDIIITDHHEAPEILPDAYAILNPKASDNINSELKIEDIESLNYLAGVGVTFKLACKLLETYNCESFVNEILPLAAVGTIGDVVELIGENRTIVAMGLELIKNGKNKGIQKLLKIAEINDTKNITAETIAFSIVPRINAAGRLECPDTAINVFVSEDEEIIDTSVEKLNELNIQRQKLCDETYIQAVEMYKKDISNNKNSIVLYNENWHIGVIGIVSSKLVENYNKPVFLMTKDTNNTNIIRCSCRSITDLNVHSILSEHKEIFEGFGGHKMAAGFSFDENKITFNNFKNLLNKTINEYSQNINFKQINIEADMELEPDDITIDLVNIIDNMQPFGAANPFPLFVMNNVKLNSFKQMGQNNKHLKLFINKNNSSVFECIKWNCPDFNLPLNSKMDILFSLKLNSFNDNISVQLVLSDFHSDLLNTYKNESHIKFLDHRNKQDILSQVLDFVETTKKNTYIYIENPSLIKKLNLDENITKKIFGYQNIPENIEQLMFFEIPVSFEIFSEIIKKTNAQIIHLMNFDSMNMNIDSYISKLSGMLKYTVSNKNGIVNINSLSYNLSVNQETIECTMELLEDISMIEYDYDNNGNYKIKNIHPIELSKVRSNNLYNELENYIENINKFKNFYLNMPIEEIKESITL